MRSIHTDREILPDQEQVKGDVQMIRLRDRGIIITNRHYNYN